jgi:AcrR family transcriptional regulator
MDEKVAPEIASQTRRRLLLAAERLVIAEGVLALTVRRIAAEADANSALIRYYFDNIDGLLVELARLNAARLSDMRLSLLDGIDARGEPDFEASVDALVLPLWASAAMSQDQRAIVVLDEIFSRADQALQHEIWGLFADGVRRVTQCLAQCLPGTSGSALAWRIRFVTAAALDVPPRSSRAREDVYSTNGSYRAIYGKDDLPERLAHFRTFAMQALREVT